MLCRTFRYPAASYAHSHPRRRRLPGLADRPALLGPRPRGRRPRQLLPPPLARGARHLLADPDRRAGRADRGLARGLRRADPALRRRGRGRRLPRRGGRRGEARGGRPLRRAALGALLDDVARARGRDPAHQRDRHPQPALLPARPRSRLPPGQAGDDGGVRHPQHRHRGGLHRDLPQGTLGHPALPQAAGLAVSLLQGPRLDQPALRLPHLGPARHRPEPGRRLRRARPRRRPATSA